jgi:hypothetical protein
MPLAGAPGIQPQVEISPNLSLNPASRYVGRGFYAITSRRTGGKKITFRLLKGKSMKEKLAGGSALVSALTYVFC